MVSTQDFGSWNIGSSPMAAASHSSKGKDRGFLILRYGFESCMRHRGMYDYEKLCFIEISHSREYSSDFDKSEEIKPDNIIRVVD